jgi:hypothetical protein
MHTETDIHTVNASTKMTYIFFSLATIPCSGQQTKLKSIKFPDAQSAFFKYQSGVDAGHI